MVIGSEARKLCCGREAGVEQEGPYVSFSQAFLVRLPGACIAPGLAADIVSSTDARRWYGN